jgi:hypothetical protein
VAYPGRGGGQWRALVILIIAHPLMFIPYFSYFHVCEGGLLPDIMHDLLEGALQYEVKVMLQEMITEERYFSLDALNSRLTTTELGYIWRQKIDLLHWMNTKFPTLDIL